MPVVCACACAAGREGVEVCPPWRSVALVIPSCLWKRAALSPTLSASRVGTPSNGAEEQEMGQPQSLSESYAFLYLCAIMAPSVSHLLGSISFLPR